jgi:hypothetical protein
MASIRPREKQISARSGMIAQVFYCGVRTTIGVHRRAGNKSRIGITLLWTFGRCTM